MNVYVTRNKGFKWLIVLLFFCCENSDKRCETPDFYKPERFVNCTYGSGSFGKWIVDEYGLPAYEYTLQQEKDQKALWWNSSGEEKRSHWHQLGNFRFVAVADNDGFVQVFTEENGFKWLNFFNEDENNFSGGFSYIDDGKEIWSTAYRFKPESAKMGRIFGMGYFKTEVTYNGIDVIRRTFAPYGDDPLVISEISIKNINGKEKDIYYYEYWDVNIHQLRVSFISSGVLGKDIPKINERKRAEFNGYFLQGAKILDSFPSGIVQQWVNLSMADELKIPPSDSAKEFDDSPSIFLLPLDGEIGDGFIFDQTRFFEDMRSAESFKKDSEIPQSLREIPALNQSLMLVHKRKIRLKPMQEVKFSYAYGYLPEDNNIDFINKYLKKTDLMKNFLVDKWKENLVYFVSEKDPFLHREMAWHSYYLQSASYWRDYLKVHVISQGGEYLFGHGSDGATRDYCIFSIPLIYINPDLAKEVLKFVMLTTEPEGNMAYANSGDTTLLTETARHPSDLDIFFLWAISEYLMATGDYGFLKEKVPFYSSKGIYSEPITSTVLDHIRTAFEHLVYKVGTGEHGLIRMGTGDWNDGIVLFTGTPFLIQQKGESTFNTAFATAILPLIAEAVEDYDGELAERMRFQSEKYKSALLNEWGGKWFYRGRDGYGNPFGHDRIFLEPQVWALIGKVLDEEKNKILIDSIYRFLDKDSPLGARILHPPGEKIFGGLLPGTDVNGGIWHAINSLLTWAYSIYAPDYAWESLKKNTLASHAEIYPDLWYGIWSGPDSYNSPESERPGEAAATYLTALTDHPVFNMNQHASPLIALIKLAGITPGKDGFIIQPRFPFRRWVLNLSWLGITFDRDCVSGYFKGLYERLIKLTLFLPEDFINSNLSLFVEQEEKEFIVEGNSISFFIPVKEGRRTEWKIFRK